VASQNISPVLAVVIPDDVFNFNRFAVKMLPLILLTLELPETLRLVNVPTLVILGCAFVYTVPATNALPT
jgi:hypothetical protein